MEEFEYSLEDDSDLAKRRMERHMDMSSKYIGLRGAKGVAEDDVYLSKWKKGLIKHSTKAKEHADLALSEAERLFKEGKIGSSELKHAPLEPLFF